MFLKSLLPWNFQPSESSFLEYTGQACPVLIESNKHMECIRKTSKLESVALYGIIIIQSLIYL